MNVAAAAIRGVLAALTIRASMWRPASGDVDHRTTHAAAALRGLLEALSQTLPNGQVA